MKTRSNLNLIAVLTLVLSFAFAPLTFADVAISETGVSGYDLVSYHTGEKPQRGNGNHVAVVDGVTYLFVNKANQKAFEANPEKYLPAYGGYCAYGVAVGKKFVGDPDVWKVVNGKLYLNLDTKIQGLWNKDVKGYIKKANNEWNQIENVPVNEL